MLSSSMAIQFKIKHIERASALVLNPTGNIFLRIRHSFLKVYRDSSSGEETVLEDHIVSEHGLPEIVIPSNALEPPVSCSLFLANALLSLNLDTPLREYLHRVVTAESVRLSHGARGFCLYAFIEAVNVVVVESQVVDWVIKKFESMVVMEKLRRRRVDDPVDVKQVEGPCAVCLEELKMGDEGEDNSNLIISMPCSHVFHQNCIFRWLEKENSCPLCRQAVKLEAADYHLSPALE